MNEVISQVKVHNKNTEMSNFDIVIELMPIFIPEVSQFNNFSYNCDNLACQANDEARLDAIFGFD
jgi:hypothetical protein